MVETAVPLDSEGAEILLTSAPALKAGRTNLAQQFSSSTY